MTAGRAAERRRHRPRGERREEIVRAAFDTIGERGYGRTTLAAVAERVGLTQQGVMHYFPTKEDLLVAVLEARDALDTSGTAAGTADRDAVLDALSLLMDINAERRGIVQTFTVLAGESVTDGHPAQRYFTRRYAALREGLTASLGGDARAAQLLIAVMDGLQIQWLLDPESVDMRAAFDAFRALLDDPAAPEPPAAGPN